jgi:hypothetical protein
MPACATLLGKRADAELPSGHVKLLLKFPSLLASARIVVLSQDWSAVLTSLMIWAVVSGYPLPKEHELSSAATPCWNSFACVAQTEFPEDPLSAWRNVRVLKLQPQSVVSNTVETSVVEV